ncbi:hypothetical protein BaRGS_00018436 [Batillaria attramentaria]|uniref:Secreted protein n=1 Tax=Batillaria attramentaria TaxID=370345 RepID=A0ABD0KSU1_9CAEN
MSISRGVVAAVVCSAVGLRHSHTPVYTFQYSRFFYPTTDNNKQFPIYRVMLKKINGKRHLNRTLLVMLLLFPEWTEFYREVGRWADGGWGWGATGVFNMAAELVEKRLQWKRLGSTRVIETNP